eukprot:GHVU01048321.1.p3 GENE.GHVU01048321.1~~GHVU01048321.1.p3  ORF type:complete len:100 (-),score=30.97 GHVU01048321.1:193-492(-)
MKGKKVKKATKGKHTAKLNPPRRKTSQKKPGSFPEERRKKKGQRLPRSKVQQEQAQPQQIKSGFDDEELQKLAMKLVHVDKKTRDEGEAAQATGRATAQ